MPLLIISNPACGNASGHTFVEQQIIPLLKSSNVPIDSIVVTKGPGDAGKAVLDFLARNRDTQSPLSVVLSSGDGTLHEIINSVLLSSTNNAQKQQITRLSFALVPSGTANALYCSLFPINSDQEQHTIEYKLLSVKAFIRSKSNNTPLSITRTTIYDVDHIVSTIFSVVVTSTSLHASILHDSEELRHDMPDLERFKVAAQKNISKLYDSKATFWASEGKSVLLYDSSKAQFRPALSTVVEMQGPFTYFLSTINTDRLEPSFIITPLYSKIPPEPGYMDVVILRPGRTEIKSAQEGVSPDPTAKITELALRAAYRNGAHVQLRYTKDGSIIDEGDGPSVVEYVRCNRWEWHPVRVQFS